MDISNQYIRDLVGDEYDQVEAEYQIRLKEWEIACETDIKNWESECEERKNNWSKIRKEIQESWREQCEHLETEYKQRLVEYEIQKVEIENYNKNIKISYEEEKKNYDLEIKSLNDQLAIKKEELDNLHGWFNGKQKGVLLNQIAVLESHKEALKKPEYESKLKMFPQEPERFSPPKQPEDSETPIYPMKPVLRDRPLRKRFAMNISGLSVLIDSLKKMKSIKYGKVLFGKYKNSSEPMKWRILDVQSDKVLLISECVLGYEEYKKKFVMEDSTVIDELDSDVWEESWIRNWLNNQFIDMTFNEDEKSIIQTSIIKNQCTIKGKGGNDTEDSVFLLSEEEVEKYFGSKEERITEDYRGDDYNENEIYAPEWMLRTPVKYKNHLGKTKGKMFVVYGGKIWLKSYHGCSMTDFGIRPALWVSCNMNDSSKIKIIEDN